MHHADNYQSSRWMIKDLRYKYVTEQHRHHVRRLSELVRKMIDGVMKRRCLCTAGRR